MKKDERVRAANSSNQKSVCLPESCAQVLVVVDVADPGLTPGGDAGAPLHVEETARLRRAGVRWHERAGLSLAPGSGCLPGPRRARPRRALSRAAMRRL